MSLLSDAQALVAELRFAQEIRHALTRVRLVRESDTDTFARIMKLAAERICHYCRGYGHMGSGITCPECKGERAHAIIDPKLAAADRELRAAVQEYLTPTPPSREHDLGPVRKALTEAQTLHTT